METGGVYRDQTIGETRWSGGCSTKCGRVDGGEGDASGAIGGDGVGWIGVGCGCGAGWDWVCDETYWIEY